MSFATEVVVGGFVLVIAAANVIAFNPLSEVYENKDNSMAARLLSYHPELNNQLVQKQTQVEPGDNSLFHKALAENSNPQVLGASTSEPSNGSAPATSATDPAAAAIIEDSGISKTNPDSVQKLVSNQVQIYETKPFDTVYTVAKQFNLTTKTIRETNGLSNNALKAGWFLVIPPVDGIVLQVTNPDLSLDDIAENYRADLNKIVSYNGFGGPDEIIADGDFLIVPGGQLPEVPEATPTQLPSPTNGSNRNVAAKPATPAPARTAEADKPSVPKASFKSANTFARGHCTYYVKMRLGDSVRWRGNANQWIRNSKAVGATVNRTPSAGSILVTNESGWGHVAYIESVSGDKVTFSEYNYAGLFVKTTRTLDIDDKRIQGVIHP